MELLSSDIQPDPAPFFVTGPGATDLLFIAVAIVLVAILLGFGALYFTIQALPDRMASGLGKTQLQVVGILGLLSLFFMNNAFWIAALLLAAIPLSKIVVPVKIRSFRRRLKKPARPGQSDA
ncbi:hypothetical protein [Roseibium sp. SCP14]|uniref:hypothetical protein n=1 Tax=Roseibium sp. SCP14 TaxID=3141375 RepID=UPI00333B888C